MPFVGETNCDAVLAERPQFLDEPIVQLTRPFTLQERDDSLAALQKFRAIAPLRIDRVGERDFFRVSAIPSVFGHAHFLRGRFNGERR